MRLMKQSSLRVELLEDRCLPSANVILEWNQLALDAVRSQFELLAVDRETQVTSSTAPPCRPPSGSRARAGNTAHLPGDGTSLLPKRLDWPGSAGSRVDPAYMGAVQARLTHPVEVTDRGRVPAELVVQVMAATRQ